MERDVQDLTSQDFGKSIQVMRILYTNLDVWGFCRAIGHDPYHSDDPSRDPYIAEKFSLFKRDMFGFLAELDTERVASILEWAKEQQKKKKE